MKNKEELNTLREECETVSRKLTELSEEELQEVAGGISPTCMGIFLTMSPLLITGFSQGGALGVSPAKIKVIGMDPDHFQPQK